MTSDKENNIKICPKVGEKVDESKKRDGNAKTHDNSHMVFNINYDIWTKLVEAYDLKDKDPIIPPK